MDSGGLAQFAPRVSVIQAPKLADDSYLVQSRQLHHGSSQSASLPGAVYPTTLYLSPHHAYIGSADRHVLPIHLNGKKRKPKSTFELAATGRKLGENLISFTACKYLTYIGKQFRRRRIFFFFFQM